MTIKAKLTDVPETMLWTLHNRATEAMREDGIIKDEKAISIFKSIIYDYEKSFGKPEPSHAIRSLDFDREIRAFLKQHPSGTIVNLGEGLETQRYRIDSPDALWLTVDLPEAIRIREQFIQPDEQHKHIALSATDRQWFAEVPKSEPVFISAQGLFMYFTEEEVKQLLSDIKQAFHQSVVMFDTIPLWLSQKTLSTTGWQKTAQYTAPPMPWGINRSHIHHTIVGWLGDGANVLDLGYSAFPRGMVKWFFLLFSRTPILKNITPTIVKIEMKSATETTSKT